MTCWDRECCSRYGGGGGRCWSEARKGFDAFGVALGAVDVREGF